jgi:hypothetical protein
MTLFQLKLDIDEIYINIIEQYLMILCAFIFMILLEPLNKFNTLSMMFYTILGMLFYNLVVKQVISFR